MAPKRSEPFETMGGELRIFFRLTPGSNKDEIFAVDSGSGGPRFKARLRAQPEKGRANAALLKLIAKWLHIPKSLVILKSGSQSRLKTVKITAPAEETIALLKKYADSLS